jgi:hypothetical protein
MHPRRGLGSWLHDILKEIVDGEQIVTPASRAGDAGFFNVRTREES